MDSLDGDESELDFSYDEESEFPNDEQDEFLREFNGNNSIDIETDNSNNNNVPTVDSIVPMIVSKKKKYIKRIQQPFITPLILCVR